MLKKIISIGLVFLLAITMMGCSEKKSTDKKEDSATTDNKPREFTESSGIVKYLTINGDKIAIPETVGEYTKYLEKIGTVELKSTEKSIEDSPDMEANERASLTSSLLVHTADKEYQTFGINYYNPNDKSLAVKDATVTRITLIYDIYADVETNPGDQTIDTMILVTDNGEIAIDGKTTSKMIVKILGNPSQNTDGYLKYVDEAGFTYKFATENQKGILTQVQIDYPKN